MLVGVHAPEAPAETLRLYPSTDRFVVREFVSGALSPQDLRPKVERLTSPWWTVDPSVIVVVSVKLRPADVADGRWDGYLRQLGQWIAQQADAGRKMWLILWHEPENDMPAAAFVAMFNRARTIVKSVYPEAMVIYSAMAYHYRPSKNAAAGDPAKAAAWMRAEADMYTVDVYSGNTWNTDVTLAEHPGFLSWHTALPDGVRWGITERGFQGDSATRAAAIREELAWLRTSTCEVYIYWATSGTENDEGWLLDDRGRAAVRELVMELSAQSEPSDPGADPYQDFTPLGELGGRQVYTHTPTGLLVVDRDAFGRLNAPWSD